MTPFQAGDIVQIVINAHKTETGAICHITENNTLFILINNSPYRLQIKSKNIQNSVLLIQKYNKDEQNLLNPSQMQSYISNTVNEDGSNYHIIALQYETGVNNFPIDFKKAMNWYSAGHHLENIHCTIALADIARGYYNDYDLAEKYYQIGINQGYIHCAYVANTMYRILANKGIPNAKQKELYYIKKYIEFTDGTDPSVLLDFAVCQLTMNTPDYSEAYKYLEKALKLNPDSIGIQQFLAIVLYRGLGCDKNEKKAIEIHKALAEQKKSLCSKLWMVVYHVMDTVDDNVHPLRDCVYDSFMDVIKTGDSHELYYGNWVKIIEYHALNNGDDRMSLCLLISLRLFGFLECDIDLQRVKNCIMNGCESNHDCAWINSWRWFFVDRYEVIKQITSFHNGLIEIITQYELSMLWD